MFRKSLFFGLTLMLAAVLVYLVIQGRRREKLQQSTPRPVEVIRSSPPSLTRVIAPDDLHIVESKMELETPSSQPGQESPQVHSARHHIVIRNDGSVAYHSIALRITYVGRANRILDTKTVPVADLLQPGQARSLADVEVENVPAGALKCEVAIAYADLEPTPEKRLPVQAVPK